MSEIDFERIQNFIDIYAWHLRSCQAIDGDGEWHVGNPDCDCGYDDELQAINLNYEE